MTENKLKLSGGRGDREFNWKGGRLAADEDQLIGGGENNCPLRRSAVVCGCCAALHAWRQNSLALSFFPAGDWGHQAAERAQASPLYSLFDSSHPTFSLTCRTRSHSRVWPDGLVKIIQIFGNEIEIFRYPKSLSPAAD